MVSAFRVERKEGPDNPDRSGLVQDGAGIQIKPELNRALAHHRPPAIAATAPDEIPAWKRCLGILEEVSGFSLRHIPAERIEQEPANIGHAFCREMGQMQCVRQGCQSFHVEMRLRALAQGTHSVIVSCPSGFCLFLLTIHGGAGGLIEGGRILILQPEKAMEHLDKRLLRLGIAAIPESFRTQYSETRHLDLERLAGVIELVRNIIASVPAPPSVHNKPEAICKALQFIGEHLWEAITIEQAAKSACLSQGYFSKLFKQSTGLTFGEYLAKTRVARARTLLRTTGRRISEIAYESGFESIPHFNRMFKRFTGVTPRQMRTGE